ncbi:hypothetical protein ACRALDRAFT_208977 [Sodiomyces alcalophilus JCM 7366]|uniref:uncharacterized protein n=1 Tax=Sodiomyces alcalophilus JCM 7366 TaxID=591952 RepID=UPI0039B4C0F0
MFYVSLASNETAKGGEISVFSVDGRWGYVTRPIGNHLIRSTLPTPVHLGSFVGRIGVCHLKLHYGPPHQTARRAVDFLVAIYLRNKQLRPQRAPSSSPTSLVTYDPARRLLPILVIAYLSPSECFCSEHLHISARFIPKESFARQITSVSSTFASAKKVLYVLTLVYTKMHGCSDAKAPYLGSTSSLYMFVHMYMYVVYMYSLSTVLSIWVKLWENRSCGQGLHVPTRSPWLVIRFMGPTPAASKGGYRWTLSRFSTKANKVDSFRDSQWSPYPVAALRDIRAIHKAVVESQVSSPVAPASGRETGELDLPLSLSLSLFSRDDGNTR